MGFVCGPTCPDIYRGEPIDLYEYLIISFVIISGYL